MSLSTIPQTYIFGVPFSKLTMEQTVDYLTRRIEARIPTQVATANPEFVMMALEQPAFFDVLNQVDLIVPDGTGIVWAASYKGEPVAERVPGYDLLHELVRKGSDQGWRVYLLGGGSEVVAMAAEKLKSLYPGIVIVGYRDGYFTEEQEPDLIKEIQNAEPHLLFVGLGAPKQELWIHRHKASLQVPVMMGVGGSFDGLAGKLKRAPQLFQTLRLEWFYRLLKQPSRWRRMLALPKFAVKVMREKDNK
jgi:N-acetylglucosaminyldiphosphoundecaprenol N-acetyl-beta-D-mannosaminyltransferase